MKIMDVMLCLEQINVKNHNKLSIVDQAALLYCDRLLHEFQSLLGMVKKENPEQYVQYMEVIHLLLKVFDRIHSNVLLGPINGLIMNKEQKWNAKHIAMALEIYNRIQEEIKDEE